MNIYQKIKEERENKKFSITDVVAFTKINCKYIEAIESGNVSIIPTAILKSCIKIYCQFLELNYDELQNEEKIENQNDENVSEEVSQNVHKFSNKKEKKISEKFKIIFVMLFILGNIFLFLQYTRDEISNVEEIPFEEIEKENNAYYTRKDSIILKIIANDIIWVLVKIDGKNQFQENFEIGENKIFIAKENFFITCGDESAISLYLNDKKVITAKDSGVILRNFLIDKNTKTISIKDE